LTIHEFELASYVFPKVKSEDFRYQVARLAKNKMVRNICYVLYPCWLINFTLPDFAYEHLRIKRDTIVCMEAIFSHSIFINRDAISRIEGRMDRAPDSIVLDPAIGRRTALETVKNKIIRTYAAAVRQPHAKLEVTTGVASALYWPFWVARLESEKEVQVLAVDAASGGRSRLHSLIFSSALFARLFNEVPDRPVLPF
jgi:hypothetical protein